ncbi:hypothetical protein CSKR_111245 [Clonorchis sinensis]|uniref:Uncharacterized protein n=1 Tax=Clonorchis sinensis TaxID=79923 RepID=A0A419PCS4_CLOSI|nr:hypothetical protein CSKR_111245 [Clonorchis sinensis]
MCNQWKVMSVEYAFSLDGDKGSNLTITPKEINSKILQKVKYFAIRDRQEAVEFSESVNYVTIEDSKIAGNKNRKLRCQDNGYFTGTCGSGPLHTELSAERFGFCLLSFGAHR